MPKHEHAADVDCPECVLCCAAGICCEMGSAAQVEALSDVIEKYTGVAGAEARKAADLTSKALAAATKAAHAAKVTP